MSEENVEIVRQSAEAWRRGEETWAEALDPGIEWDNSTYPAVGVAMSGKGREDFVEFMRRYRASWHRYELNIEEYIDAGEDVVTVIHETIRAPGSDAPIERRFAQIWSLRDGLIVGYRPYPNKGMALEAAGLSE